MNPAFREPLFWQLYYELESQDSDGDVVLAQLNTLAQEFRGVSSAARPRVLKAVEFCFQLGAGALLLEYAPDANGTRLELRFRAREKSALIQMGWWDLARWHPYCMRLAELKLIVRYLATRDSALANEHLSFLLLAPFVALCDVERHALACSQVVGAMRTVCPRAVGFLPEPPLTLLTDTRWMKDTELGWLLVADEQYDCYSLRNGSHAKVFPFVQWRRTMIGIKRAL